jgi:adenine-specific DNA-methyltransferase
MKSTFDKSELERTEKQVRIDSAMGAVGRNKSGQFATPPTLAEEIAGYVNALWKEREDKIRFFEPALGSGAFFSALVRTVRPGLVEEGIGVEINPELAKLAEELWGDARLSVINADFTSLEAPAPEKRFNLIVTNPPYVRHHHLNQDDKVRLKYRASSITSGNISGLAGLYCYFMVLSHDWLADDGIGVWLIPSEFMDVKYGTVLKEYLLKQVTLLQIHRFDPTELQFDDALTSSAVVVYQKRPPIKAHCVNFSYGGSLPKPLKHQAVPSSELLERRKWTGIVDRNGGHRNKAEENELSLSSLFVVKRGIATGANNFFILPRQRAIELGIDKQFLKPILPSPRYLRDVVIESDEEGYPQIEEPLALIDSSLPEEVLKTVCRPLWEYLCVGEGLGIRDTYLAGKRTPWYRQEQRAPAPFVCTYMGRSGKNGNPFRFIWNKSAAVAPNVYHLLYPVGALRVALERKVELPAKVFELLRQIESNTLVGEGRVYGGGLYKLEPSELGNVGADQFKEILEPFREFQPAKQVSLFAGS